MTTLQDLPSELRYQIYQFVFPPRVDYQCLRVPKPTYNKSILQLNRNIRHEALPVLYSKRRFCFQDENDLEPYIGCLDPFARAIIESITIEMYTPPYTGHVCDFIRPVELGLKQMSAMKELQLRIILRHHNDAAKLGLEFTKLVRPLFSRPMTLKITTARCLLCENTFVKCGRVFEDFTHHQWTWVFLPGAIAPQTHRTFYGSIRPLVRDRLLACGIATRKSPTSQETREILSHCKRSVISPAISENRFCNTCQSAIGSPSSVDELLMRQCSNCDMDKHFFCCQDCERTFQPNWTNWPHHWICVDRGWTAKEKSYIQLAVDALNDLGDEDQGEDVNLCDNADACDKREDVHCILERVSNIGI